MLMEFNTTNLRGLDLVPHKMKELLLYISKDRMLTVIVTENTQITGPVWARASALTKIAC